MALSFGATTNDRVAATGGPAAGQSYTILLWHFPTTVTAGRRWFAFQTPSGLHDVLWSFTASGPFFDVPMASGSASADSSKTYATSKWWMNAFTYSDADGPRIYSGDLATEAAEDPYNSRSTTGTSIAGDIDSTIANINTGTVAYQGSIAIFARFNRILTLAEIRRWQYAPFVDADCVQFYELGYDGAGTQKNLANLGTSDGTVTSATVAAHVPINSWFRQPAPRPNIAVVGGVLKRDFQYPFGDFMQPPPASGPAPVQIAVDAVLTLATNVVRVVQRNVPTGLTLLAAVSRIVNRNTSVPLTLTASVLRTVNRQLATALTLNADVSRIVQRSPVAVTLTLVPAIAMARILSRAVAVTLTLQAAVVRQVNRPVNVALTLQTAISRIVNRQVSTPLTLQAAVSRIVNRQLSTPLTLTANVSRVVTRLVATPLTLITAVSRIVNRTVSTPLTLNAVMSFIKIGGGPVVNIAVNATLTLNAAVRMSPVGAAVARARKWITTRFGIY